MRWRKASTPKHSDGQTNKTVYLAFEDEGMYQAIDAGNGSTKIIENAVYCHWIVALCIGNGLQGPVMKEPTYKQKVEIIQELGKWNKIALETFPSKSLPDDEEQVYHLLEFEDESFFVYDMTPIFEEPNDFEGEIDFVKYHIRQVGKITYIYLKDNYDRGISWTKKQKIKEHLIPSSGFAIEVISEKMLDKEYTCLIVLPDNVELNFEET